MTTKPTPENALTRFTHYLIVGNGRVARHFKHYFDFELIPYKQWSRRDPTDRLEQLANEASHVLLLISDSEIENFYRQRPFLSHRTCVSFSGLLTLNEIFSAHPLMTFTNELYSHEVYRTIPFVLERGRGNFAQLLPQLPNSHWAIDAKDKALYHALCVLGGNFSIVLWEKVFREFQQRFDLPREALLPYLKQINSNLLNAGEGSVLSGPLVRKDNATLVLHERALAGDPYQTVYHAVVEAWNASQTLPSGGLQ